ncbi:SLC13 family permease [Pontibacillus marinus]|uniref:Sulfur deprivation response regulator n=1 Tax=Pontibacillus marinus BH030004 = DSM 16465 TaxID=1385511 RepID=A0A0A5I7K2_9BACI|nr:SLC13 family permease [Pontibacillus marinus]KGX91817.1 sulfur deprivation response regulator [Pontibacillus marinus BH030004 = DSM 16465]
MSSEMIIVMVTVLLMLIGLIFEITRPDLIVLGTLFLFILMGFVSPEQALAGFSNPGMLTIALLFIVAKVFENSGLIERYMKRFLEKSNTSTSALARIVVPISGVSAFLNNTPIVVTLTPIIQNWATKHNLSPSKFLIPLSYAAIMGGTVTLMGTSTNLVIHGLLLDFNTSGLSFFQLALVGIPVTLVGLLYLIFFAPKRLPNHPSLKARMNENTKDYLSELIVLSDFPYINRTVEDAGLRNLEGIYLIEIIRKAEKISPVTRKTLLQEGDRLIFTGKIGTMANLQKRKGLQFDTGTDLTLDDLKNGKTKLQEIVISHQSTLTGKTIKANRFRNVYDAAVIAVHRNNERVKGKVGDIAPKAGDVLLLIAGEEFEKKSNEQHDFYVTSHMDSQPFHESESKGWWALAILGVMILLVTFQVLSIFKAMALTVGLFLITNMITIKEAKSALQFQVLLLIASAIGIGNVIIETGTAKWMANQLISHLAPLGTLAILLAIYILTNIFTELITNNAAAVIMFPIAFEVAKDANIEPIGMAIMVAMAASASFLSPIGYQTNLIVYGPGGYKFKDYTLTGLPLTIIAMVITVGIVYFQFA